MSAPPVQEKGPLPQANEPIVSSPSDQNNIMASHPAGAAPSNPDEIAASNPAAGSQPNLASSPPPNQQPSPLAQGPPTYEDAAASKARAANGQGPPNNGMPMQHGPVMVTPLISLGENPAYIDCPWCNRQTTTVVQKEGTSMQVAVGVILCLFCICLTCLPCVCGWFEETQHSCANCKKRVATVPENGGPPQLHLPPNMVQVASQYQSHPPPMAGPPHVPSQHQPQSPPPAHVQKGNQQQDASTYA